MGGSIDRRSNEGDGFDPGGEWTVGDILRAMAGGDIPRYVERLASQVQEWMILALSGEGELSTEDYLFGFGDRKQGDPEALISQLEWVEEFADILPATSEPAGHEEAVALCFGPVDFDEGMRMAIDYAALFGRDHCRRVWMLSDSWVIGEVVRYVQHFKALSSQGVELRFIMVTPWGWTEIPIALETGDNDRLHWEARSARQDHNNNPMKPKKRDDPNQK